MLLLQQVVLKLHQLKRAHPQKLITSNQLHLKVPGGGSASAEPAKPTETKAGGTGTGDADGKPEAGKEAGSSSAETGGKDTDKKESADVTPPEKMDEGSKDSKCEANAETGKMSEVPTGEKGSTDVSVPSNTVSNPEATDTEHSV